MINQNTSKFEVRSSSQDCMLPPHAWSADPSRSSSPSNTNLNANKYSFTNSNHTLINDFNYTYNVYEYTILDDCSTIIPHEHILDKGFYGSYTYDNDNYSTFINGKYKFNNSVYSEGKCNNSNIMKDAVEEEDSFTFSSAADSMESFNFNSSACANEADARMLMQMSSMSPADELFQDGKIRPLIRPISNRHDQPNCFEPLVDQHSSFNAFAAQYRSSANHSGIKQELHADYSQGSLQHQELDHGLSSESDRKLKELYSDQLECQPNYAKCVPNYAESHSQNLSLSAPTSPVKQNWANEKTDNQGSPEYYSSVVSTCQVNCYRRCRSLSRVFQIEDNEQILEVQDRVEDGTKEGLLLNYKRKTLQDLLTQEGNSTSKLEMMKKGPCKMVNEKQLGLTSPNRGVKSFYDAERRPSLAPAPINTPHLWPIREKVYPAPPTNGKSSKKMGALSPHELHYGCQKAQADRLKKKTFLPYKPGLLGCLGYPPHH